jgi:hypothetical protein
MTVINHSDYVSLLLIMISNVMINKLIDTSKIETHCSATPPTGEDLTLQAGWVWRASLVGIPGEMRPSVSGNEHRHRCAVECEVVQRPSYIVTL